MKKIMMLVGLLCIVTSFLLPGNCAETHLVTVVVLGAGTVSPNSVITVNDGDTVTFTITPDSGNSIKSILFDHAPITVLKDGKYTTPNIDKDSTLYVEFEKCSYTQPDISTFGKNFLNIHKGRNITFGTLNIGVGFQVEEYGIVYSKTNPFPTIDEEGALKFQSKTNLNSKGQFGIELLDPKYTLGKEYYTRAYVIYTINGIQQQMYASDGLFTNMNQEAILFSQLSERMVMASPGDEIIIKDGTYENLSLTIAGEGSEGLPIVIKSETEGGVVITGNSGITITGKHIEISGFRMENIISDTNVFQLDKASNCRITDCYFYNVFGATISSVKCISIKNLSQNNRIDHNVFETTGGGVGITVSYNDNTLNTYNQVDHNYFKDVPRVSDLFPGETNGFEQVGAGTAITHDHNKVYLTVEDNLFENIIGDNSEIVVSKSSNNAFRYNTFLNCTQSGPDFRCGNNCTFEGNFCINSKTGIRSYGANQVIKNNYFYNCARGLELTSTNEGYVYEEGSQYRQTKNAVVTGNLFIYPSVMGIKLGSGFNPLNGYIYVPENTTLTDNTFVVDRAPAISYSNSMFDHFLNNKVSLSGAGSVGSDSNGFETENTSLVFDGQIYVPKGVVLDKRGLKTINDVGPINKWWIAFLKNPPDSIAESVKEPDTIATSYTPAKTEIIMIKGETYHLGELSGTVKYSDNSYPVLSKNVGYTIDNTNVATINGNNLIAQNNGTAYLSATYKNIVSKVKVRVINSSANNENEEIYTNTFDHSDAITAMGNTEGVWKVVDGKLTNSGITSSASRMIIDHSAVIEGDFSISCDMTIKDYSDAGILNGTIILGYQNARLLDYYSVTLGNTNAIENNIYKYQDTISNNIGFNNAMLTKDVPNKVEVRKTGDKLIVSVNNTLVGIADVKENLMGRIGFASTNILEIDNLSITRIAELESITPQSIAINIVRTDVEEVELSFSEITSDVIYRVYRNDIWLYDTKEPKYIDESIRKEIGYHYVVKAFDMNGELIGNGEFSYSLPSAADSSLFQITNCSIRTGYNGAFETCLYKIRNKGLYNGQRKYSDRVYQFTSVPAELENSAYIMTRNEDISFSVLQDPNTTDFIKFDINKSATVYLLVAPNKITTLPTWITNGWELTDINFDGFTKIYQKHYNVPDGSTTTIEIGGFQSKLPSMYSIVIKPNDNE